MLHVAHVKPIAAVSPACLLANNQDWISDEVDIRQLMIETHRLGPGNPADMFDDIQHAGFAMFSKEPNIFPMVGGRCVEWSFVRLHRDFFRHPEGGSLASDEK
jgi:Methyltransferase domain